MTTSLDFNQDDFDKYYTDLHKSTMANATQELQKMKFKDEASKIIKVNSLESELNGIYATEKPSKTAEFVQHEGRVSMLVNAEFENYKNDLNSNINYESQTDFEGYIDSKHSTAKNAAIARFENSKLLAFTPKKSHYKKSLEAKIDTEYTTWKITTKETYKGKERERKTNDIQRRLQEDEGSF